MISIIIVYISHVTFVNSYVTVANSEHEGQRGSNPVEALTVFQAKICNCLNCDYNCNDHISISSVFPQFKSSSFDVSFLSRVKINSINWSAPNMGLSWFSW